MADQTVVTRFAPSPSGALHVGGARTALFNWAYARRHGGRFILRMEDTDRARSSVEAARGILADLRWLGLDWDEGPPLPPSWEQALREEFDPFGSPRGEGGPYFQSRRKDAAVYEPFVERLRDAGVAYDDDGAVRFKMPGTDVTVEDAILGEVTVAAADLEDFVIVKSDGYPTYHLAVVVDDALMGVTHVIRGQEHLNNVPKHAALQDALEIERPTFAHIPLIFNADGSKMSKRDKAKAARAAALDACPDAKNRDALVDRVVEMGPAEPVMSTAVRGFLEKDNDGIQIARAIASVLDVALPEIEVDDFRASGYLPEALVNYTALLGWSPGGHIEKFEPDAMSYLREHFGLEGVNKSNARFDREKLFRFNADVIAAMSTDDFVARFREHCRRYGPKAFGAMSNAKPDQFRALAEAYQPRARTLAEPSALGQFFVVDAEEIEFDEKAVRKVLHKNDCEGLDVLEQLRPILDGVEDWSDEVTEATVKEFATANALGMGKVAQPLRVAVSGGTVSPSIGQTLAILGKAATVERIDRCVSVCRAPTG
ncbi:MAG: hypothetical protein CMJ49_14235 [Planctomycetaceae bacterium]|nr:hypothetical protein [Planctomycetaceae bacterium]